MHGEGDRTWFLLFLFVLVFLVFPSDITITLPFIQSLPDAVVPPPEEPLQTSPSASAHDPQTLGKRDPRLTSVIVLTNN